jgi:hypothetical protein
MRYPFRDPAFNFTTMTGKSGVVDLPFMAIPPLAPFWKIPWHAALRLRLLSERWEKQRKRKLWMRELEGEFA